MLSYLVCTPCDACYSASNLMERLNTGIASYGRILWLNKAFMLKKPMSDNKLKRLLYYKDILDNLIFDPFYYGTRFSYESIDSRIKALINGLH